MQSSEPDVTMAEPIWLTDARKFIGLREIPGAPTEPIIAGWLKKLGAWWSNDEIAWCGTYVAAVMQGRGYDIPKHWYRARAWLDWGDKIDAPDLGCIVVFERGGGGHVGFVTGRDRHSNLLVLGGNQGDAVSIAAFPRARVLGYRKPKGTVLVAAALPLGLGELSRSEA